MSVVKARTSVQEYVWYEIVVYINASSQFAKTMERRLIDLLQK